MHVLFVSAAEKETCGRKEYTICFGQQILMLFFFWEMYFFN